MKFTTRLLWWKDGSVTDLLCSGCLPSGMCWRGTWFDLDARSLVTLGRVWYAERAAP